MAIVKMNKFTLFAFKKDKEALLDNLQKFEGVQFIDLQEKAAEESNEEQLLSLLQRDSEELKVSDIEDKISQVKSALDFLNQYIPKEKGLKVAMEGKRSLTYDELANSAKKVDFISICEQIKLIEQRLSFLKTQIVGIENEINLLKPWKSFDVSLEQLEKFNYANTFLGAVPLNLKEKFKQEVENNVSTAYIENISDVRDGSNFFIIVHKEENNILEEIQKKYGFTHAALNFKGECKNHIKNLQEKISECKNEIEEKSNQIFQFKEDIPLLELSYEYLNSEANKARSVRNFLKTDQTVVIEGWVTQEESEELTNIIKASSGGKYYLELNEADSSEDVPILLKNNKFVTPFESFITMYGMPKYDGYDPTAAVVPFYMLFYGLMLSDAAYGLIQFIACAVVLKTVKLTDSMRDMVRLFLYLSIPTIFVGILYGSYFCGAIKIPPIWMDPTQNVILLLLVSFGIGLIQIFVGLGIKGYLLFREGKIIDIFFDVVLWIVTLVSLIVALAGSMGNVAALSGAVNISKYILIAGLIGLALTQGRANEGIGAKLGAGLYEVYGITGYIGDIVSYSRLMALGLATSFIGGAFNSMIGLLGGGIAAWIFGPVIFIVGHLFNLGINALGSYVHSLRLQYLEYFGKFYEPGGKPFTPFKSKGKFINITKTVKD